MGRSCRNHRGVVISDGEEDDDDTPLSLFVEPRKLEMWKKKKNKGLEEEVSRVSDDRGAERPRGGKEEEEENDIGSEFRVSDFRAGDLVWAKAFPGKWCPGWVRSSTNGEVLVTFFAYQRRTLRFPQQQVLSFENNFEEMLQERIIPSAKLADAIESAVAELSSRMVVGFLCGCCQEDNEEEAGECEIKGIGVVRKEEYDPVKVLEFVHRVAVCPWIEEGETIRVVRQGAQVNAFRRYNSIKRDWIYRETMRISQGGSTASDKSTSQERRSHSSSDYEIDHLVSQEADFSDDDQEGNVEVLSEQVKNELVICKKSNMGTLHELVRHLYGLALDPFYSGAQGSLMENSAAVCRKILRYRELVFAKVLDQAPMEHNYEAEISKVWKTNRQNSVACPRMENGNETEESRLFSSVWEQHKDKGIIEEGSDYMKDDSVFSDNSSMEPLVINAADLTQRTLGCQHDIERPKNSEDAVLRFAESEHVDNLSIAKSDGQEPKLPSDHPENLGEIQPSNKGGIRSPGMIVDTQSHDELQPFVSKKMLEDANATNFDGRVGVALRVSSESPSRSNYLHKMDPSNDDGFAAKIVSNEVKLRLVSEGSLDRSGRQTRSTTDDLLKFQPSKIQYPPGMLYATPLSAETSAPSGPTTLHIKFPKDFEVPSKEELIKKFRPFGQLDYLKTRTFFYTGSAQVAFLRFLDAQTAFQYVKRNKIFVGGVKLRCWLDKEHSRKEPTNISAPSSPIRKSCLKTLDPEGKKDKRKPHQVKFGSKISSSGTTRSNQESPSNSSNSFKFNEEGKANIAQQLLVLLEECNQLVSKIKDEMGLESYHSMYALCNHAPKTVHKQKNVHE